MKTDRLDIRAEPALADACRARALADGVAVGVVVRRAIAAYVGHYDVEPAENGLDAEGGTADARHEE